MGLLIGSNLILVFCGYLLPLPSVIMAWREWSRGRRIRPVKAWHRIVSQFGFWLLTLGVALWVYAIVREAWHHDYSYVVLSASVGRWGSLGSIIVCSLAERRLRRYLLFGAVGLLFFFGSSIGDLTI